MDFILIFFLGLNREEFLREITGLLKDSRMNGTIPNHNVEKVITKEEQMSRVLSSIIGDDTMDVEEIAKNYYRAKNKKEVKHFENKGKKADDHVEKEESKEDGSLLKEEDDDDDYTDIDDSGDEKPSKEKQKRK